MTSNEPRESGFIGRQPELAVLTAVLDDAIAGRGQMVMLAGEPGIGKTRLAQELASRAESLGAQVLWGWCYEHAGAPPYWPYVQPIRAYVETADADQLRTQMGPGGAEIAEIVPELRAKLPDLEQPFAAKPEQARFRLFDSVATFLKNASQSRPLVFVIDDLHWADESSLLMLEFLAKEISASPLLILGTYRDVEVTGRHPLSQTLGNLVREQHFRRVALGGLTEQEVGEFVEANAGVTLPSDALATIHSRTEGNPLFVNEVVGLIDPDQITENRAWAEIIPEGVRDAIGRRLSRLSENCNQVLRTASVIGREFEFSLLRGLDSDIGTDVVLEALEEALEAKVIEPLPVGAERYQFGHALIQQALYGEMSHIRRVRAHARIGETLEQLHQAGLEEHAAELAHHFAEAEAVIGSEKLGRYSLMAGERALATYAYEDALTHFEKGLVARDIALSGTEAATDEEAAALLFGLGRAQTVTFERIHYPEALNSLTRAFDYYVGVGDVPKAVAIAEQPIPLVAGAEGEIARLLSRALTLVPPDSHEAARIMSHYTRPMAGVERATEALGCALTIARREEDIALEIRTLTNTGRLVRGLYRYQESLDMFLQAIDLARPKNDLHSEVVAGYWAALAQSNLGHLEGMRLTAAACLQAAERLHDRSWLALTFWNNQFAAKLEGAWQEAREFGDRGLSVSPRECRILYSCVLVEHEVGEFDLAERYLENLLDAMRETRPGSSPEYSFVSGLIPMVAAITGKSDRLSVAEEAAQFVLQSTDTGGLGELVLFARTGLGLIAVLKNDAEVAREQYSSLEPFRGLMVMLGGMANDRLLGLLSRTMGDSDQAAAHFEDALTFCRKAGYRPELAWSCCDYADMLLDPSTGSGRAEGENRAKAMSLLDESLAISGDLGMRPLMERVVDLQQRAEAKPVPAPAFPDGLTQREVEVIGLVALGKTDREIAEELFISIKTVGNHVSNILNKTSAANRTEATSYAHTHGLVGPNSEGEE